MLDRPMIVALVSYPGAQRAAIDGLADLFSIAGTAQPVAGSGGGERLRVVRLECDLESAALQSFDAPAAVVVPPSLSDPPAAASLPWLAPWLYARHAEGSILASVCAGTFLLAATGLLDGRPAASHWQCAERFAREFPQVLADPDRLLVDDGDILTSGGIMSWPDIGLRIVEKLLGAASMTQTARYLLIDPPRAEQRVYRHFAPALRHGDPAVLKVQHWLRTGAAVAASVTEMAQVSGLEERTFLRRFHRATGLTPVEYLQAVRVENGRNMLEATTLPIDRIAWEVGYQDPGAFRKIFVRTIGISPAAYRRRFALHPNLPRAIQDDARPL